MALNQDVSWFVPFRAHNPSRNKNCICYAPSRKARCRASCERQDNRRAIELHKIINDLPAEAVDTQLIEEYILSVCCRFAYHRDRIEDLGLLTPLAERWLDEITIHATEQSRRAVSPASLGANTALRGAATVSTISTPSRAIQAYTAPTANTTPTAYPTPPVSTSPPAYTTPTASPTLTASPLRYRYNTPTPNEVNTTPPIPVSSALNSLVSPSRSSITSLEIAPIPPEIQPRYNLRHRDAKTSTNASSVRSRTSPRPPLSEFRAHISEPGPTDSVSSKIQDNLIDRDFETGSLYIFDRTSSPGHVKIGWTASSVSRRLESWSECGYTPNLLFQVDGVPHAQRVETLTHYELIKEWRRERMCKAEWCRKSHREWFEVSKERAKQVLSDWAKFAKVAKPYDANGCLKIEWKDFVKKTAKSGETVTATQLLAHYEMSLVEDTTLVEESAEPEPEPKIEEQEEGASSAPKLENIEDTKGAVARLDSLRTELWTELLTSAKDSQLYKSEALPAPVPLTSISSPRLKEQPKIDPVKFEPLAKPEFSFTTRSSHGQPLPKFEDLFRFDSPPRTVLPATAKSSPEGMTKGVSKTEMLPRSEFTFTTESPLKTKRSPKTKEFLRTEDWPKQFSFTSKSPFNFEPIPKTEAQPKGDFTCTTGVPQFKFEPSWESSATPTPDSLFGTGLLSKTKPLQKDAAAETALADKGVSPEKIQSTSSPLVPPPLASGESEGDGQVEAVSEPGDRPIHESVIKVEDADESAVTEIEPSIGDDEWDNEETLVETEPPGSLKEAALKIVEAFCPDTSIGKTNGLEVLESEVTPVVQVIAQT
ncbi:uncharacterized protein BDR25DRAFT_307089 [Lindgomyces ingoldianus]|uniref:Uncharacterized protein n=1 Tax=Lindgomyces ingoldianus TaxID=673940 RepID=A0ACB6QFA3_9PLEO|nr:uncharacterized protein BDR25DRAFT_307089 [Lindgomyces ingoldianus]KAF2464797.1 hypothetical protein BDR25DRAFT_307089 [Lindgomyces ingoldianus]